ncbi:hypothetical protein SARC_16050, partial [Sphaeroforma arctica JP610]
SKKSVSNSIQAFTAHTDGTMSGGIQCMNVNGEDIMMYSNYTEDDKPRMHVVSQLTPTPPHLHASICD